MASDTKLEEATDVAAGALYGAIHPQAGDFETADPLTRYHYKALALPVVVALQNKGVLADG